jgi:hypothetical protein
MEKTPVISRNQNRTIDVSRIDREWQSSIRNNFKEFKSIFTNVHLAKKPLPSYKELELRSIKSKQGQKPKWFVKNSGFIAERQIISPSQPIK